MIPLAYVNRGHTIRVMVCGKRFCVWPRNATTDAMANGLISPPADVEAAIEKAKGPQ